MNFKFSKTIIFAGSLCLITSLNHAQTITFTQDDPTNWSDGIAQDGDGGSTNVSGLTMQIYEGANTTSNTQMSGSTMIWENATWFASANNFNGITAGPDVSVSNNGMPALVIKSSSQSVNFNITSIQLLDWGGVPAKITAYDNGIVKGGFNLNLPSDGTAITFNSGNGLTNAIFGNIDEIRITPVSDPVIWVGVNNLVLATLPLAIDFTSLKALLNQDNTVHLTWETGTENNTKNFTIEQSSNGKNFTNIGTVNSKGNSTSTQTYSYNTPCIQQQTYFRIKEEDKNGESIYSQIVVVALPKTKSTIMLYPNPASNVINVVAATSIKAISIFSMDGKLLQQSFPNSTNTTFNIAALPFGNYMTVIESEDGIVKQHLTKR